MKLMFLGLAAASCGGILFLLGDRVQRSRRKLAADARARVFLETWQYRADEAKRIDAWSKSDSRHDART